MEQPTSICSKVPLGLRAMTDFFSCRFPPLMFETPASPFSPLFRRSPPPQPAAELTALAGYRVPPRPRQVSP